MDKEDKKVIKKGLTFKKFLKIYIIILIILMIIFLTYVICTLIKYENLQIDNYLANTVQEIVQDGKKGKISNYIDISKIEVSNFESKNISISEAISNLLENNNVTYKLNSDSIDLNNPVYDAYIDNKLILKIHLNGEEKITRLGILTFQNWKIDNITFEKENGVYECNIEVPSNYKVYVNDIELTENEKTEDSIDEGLVQISKYVDIPYIVKYKVSKLLKEPKIIIQDEEGKEQKYIKENNTFKVDLDFKYIADEYSAMQEIKGNIDILKIAKDWSLYLTDDLTGNLHGFYKISKYLIKDSDMWNFAYKWATNVDITFVSSHTLDKQCFTNTKVKNFKIYNDNAFSCEVYLQKNMILKGNKKLQDVMKEKMYFAYYKGEWKLVNMQSITEN